MLLPRRALGAVALTAAAVLGAQEPGADRARATFARPITLAPDFR